MGGIVMGREEDCVSLVPTYYLDDDWENPELIRSGGAQVLSYGYEGSSSDEGLKEWIESTRIEVSRASLTTKLNSDESYDYYKTELGMNIIVPNGSIEELRFKVILSDHEPTDDIIALDGFPKNMIDNSHIVSGNIKLGITKAFGLIPVVGSVLSDLLDIQLNPWDFKLGDIRDIKINFSGGLTQEPEWFFTKSGIQNELRVALTIRKPKNIIGITGNVQAAWLYDPGIFSRTVVQSDDKNVKIV